MVKASRPLLLRDERDLPDAGFATVASGIELPVGCANGFAPVTTDDDENDNGRDDTYKFTEDFIHHVGEHLKH